MSRTFSYRRREVVQGSPTAAELKARWPALFNVNEINTEFERITTLQPETTFMAELDKVTPAPTSFFLKRGGVAGQRLSAHLQILHETTSNVHQKMEAVLRALCCYLGEDDGSLIDEYKDIQCDDIPRDMEKHSMGVYVIKKEEAEGEDPEDVGVFVEGVILMENLRSPARACAAILGVIYAINLAYPKELRYYYEFIQKVVMQMNGEKLSPKSLG